MNASAVPSLSLNGDPRRAGSEDGPTSSFEEGEPEVMRAAKLTRHRCELGVPFEQLGDDMVDLDLRRAAEPAPLPGSNTPRLPTATDGPTANITAAERIEQKA